MALAVDASADLPTEFRIFRAGWNDTSKGRFLFDEKAAELVMSAWQAWGVELSIDLEHQMFDAPAGCADPTARDARGWFKLAVRDGDLWMVAIRWAPDGVKRLTELRQRYISPAFNIDPESNRVIEILNVAIVAMPATHDAPALVAASRGDCMMSPEVAKQALEVVENQDADGALAIVKKLLEEAATGGDESTPADDPDPEDPGADEDEEKTEEAVAASARLLRLSGKNTFVAAVEEVEIWRESHLKLASETAKLESERATIEAAQRRQLCVELVTKAGRAPATVWADPLKKDGAPKAYLATMSLENLREYVKDAIAAVPEAVRSQLRTPTAAPTVSLSARELALCAEKKIDPAAYAAIKKKIGKA